MKKVIVSVIIVAFLSGCIIGHGKHKGAEKGGHKGSEHHKPRR